MTGITDLVKCPSCHRKGTMDLIVRSKNLVGSCRVCDEIISERVPYSKHRVDHQGYQYHYKIGSVRPITVHEDDEMTCTQEEWEENDENF